MMFLHFLLFISLQSSLLFAFFGKNPSATGEMGRMLAKTLETGEVDLSKVDDLLGRGASLRMCLGDEEGMEPFKVAYKYADDKARCVEIFIRNGFVATLYDVLQVRRVADLLALMSVQRDQSPQARAKFFLKVALKTVSDKQADHVNEDSEDVKFVASLLSLAQTEVGEDDADIVSEIESIHELACIKKLYGLMAMMLDFGLVPIFYTAHTAKDMEFIGMIVEQGRINLDQLGFDQADFDIYIGTGFADPHIADVLLRYGGFIPASVAICLMKGDPKLAVVMFTHGADLPSSYEIQLIKKKNSTDLAKFYALLDLENSEGYHAFRAGKNERDSVVGSLPAEVVGLIGSALASNLVQEHKATIEERKEPTTA